MITVRDTGVDNFLTTLENDAPKRERFGMQFGNAVDYAGYLQNRHGYFVIDDEHLLNTVTSFLARLANVEHLTDEMVEQALEDAATEEVRHLQAFIGQMRPPIRAGGPQRPARQGRWADRTTTLANGFYARVGLRPIKRYPIPAVPFIGSPHTAHPKV